MSSILLFVVLLPYGCNSDDVVDNAEDVVGIIEDVCPGGRAVLGANRTISVSPSYDGGHVEHWFTIARGLVNSVKKDNLPYDVIEEGIEKEGVACDVGTKSKEQCQNVTVSSFKVEEMLSNFLQWWTPILMVSAVGLAVGLVFLLSGCVFWICWCCGKCGGGHSQKHSHDCAMCVSTVLLLLSVLGLLSGVVLTFYSNQQSFDSLKSVHVAVDTATDHGVQFTEDLINDGIDLFCLIVDIVHLSFRELKDLGQELGRVVDDISDDVEEFLDPLEQNVNATVESLGRVITLRIDLDQRQREIETALRDVADLAMSVLHDCEESGADCRGLPNPSIFFTVANFSKLPDLSNTSASVNVTLSQVDFEEEVHQGRSNFSSRVSMIKQNITMHINESKMELERLNEAVIEQRDNITNSTREVIRRDQSIYDCSDFRSILNGEDNEQTVDINAGYIQHCIVDQGFQDIRQYDSYRYGFGVAVCCLSMMVVILVLLGLLLGVIGWRRGRVPYDRTTISHCGGRFLLIAVGGAYLFGCMVMVLSGVGFFFGFNAQKVCQSLEGPEYEGFVNIVDNQELWGGSLLGKALFDDPQKTLSLSQLLRNCEDNYALYKAMNLSFLFDIHTDIINFTEVKEVLNKEIYLAAESIQFSSDSFFSSTGLQTLKDFNNDIGNIDFDAFLVEAPILGFNVSAVVHNLTVYNATVNETVQPEVNQLISDILEVSWMAQHIDAKADSLMENVTSLQTLVTTSSMLVTQATEIMEYITGEDLVQVLNNAGNSTFTRIAQYIDDFIQDLTDGLNNNIGRCRPLWGIYEDLYISVCYDVVDGLNGFWFSLGICGLFFIPVIVLSVITSTCYMKQKTPISSTHFMDDPYADYLMDDSSKRNSTLSVKDINNYAPSEDQV